MATSIFLDFNLPNATTWFYFSLLLGVALFFKFSRLLSMRNWDVLTMFALVPGLLLLLDPQIPQRFGYAWLLSGSAYFLVRSLVDLALVRRPALAPNLSLGGLAWMGGALLASLVAVAVRQPMVDRGERASQAPASVKQVEQQGEKLVNQGVAPGQLDRDQTRIGVERALAMLCHIGVVAGLVFVGWWHFQDLQSGVAAATFYLLLPYTFLLLPYAPLNCGQWYHVLPMALLVWAVAAYRQPFLAGLLFGLASGIVYFPALALPVWLSFYWRRGASRFATAVVAAAGLSLAITASLLWREGHLTLSLQSAAGLSDWQAWKQPHTDSLWSELHWAYRIPVFIAYLAFVVTTLFWPAPKTLAHVLSLTAAVFIGIQFWYADRGGIYVLWYLPFLMLMVFRPNLSDRVPPIPPPRSQRAARLWSFAKAQAAKLLWLPAAPLQVR